MSARDLFDFIEAYEAYDGQDVVSFIADWEGRLSSNYSSNHYPADFSAVDYILAHPINTGDGRSEWRWFHLPNGDLVLGFFPQGDACFATETQREIDYARSREGSENCSVCGQPDNCGDCDHTPI